MTMNPHTSFNGVTALAHTCGIGLGALSSEHLLKIVISARISASTAPALFARATDDDLLGVVPWDLIIVNIRVTGMLLRHEVRPLRMLRQLVRGRMPVMPLLIFGDAEEDRVNTTCSTLL